MQLFRRLMFVAREINLTSRKVSRLSHQHLTGRDKHKTIGLYHAKLSRVQEKYTNLVREWTKYKSEFLPTVSSLQINQQSPNSHYRDHKDLKCYGAVVQYGIRNRGKVKIRTFKNK